MKFCKITDEDNIKLADIIRDNLKKHKLDIPGTAYYDEELNCLSRYYLADSDRRFYYVLKDDGDNVIGGIGLAEIDLFEDCAELQKLYLTDSAKGSGLGYRLVEMIEEKARQLGYRRIYLETHTNLEAAIHIYEKCGYRQIEKPAGIVHATMNRFYIKEL